MSPDFLKRKMVDFSPDLPSFKLAKPSAFSPVFRHVSSPFAPSTSSNSPALQFFVRLISGNALVVHADPSDTVESVMRHIHSLTGIPVDNQRLIYRGRQLQCDYILSHCRIERDACLSLTARLRSTRQPRAWRILNDLVWNIYCLENNLKPGYVIWTRNCIDYLVKQFLTTTVLDMGEDKEQGLSYLRVFTLSGADSALVKLYLSADLENRAAAEKAIQLFLMENPDYVPEFVYPQCAPIVLQFCKMLCSSVGREDHLYVACRSALASMLKASFNTVPLVDLGSCDLLMDIRSFVTELVGLVECALCKDSMFVSPVLLTDLSNFLIVMRRTIQELKDTTEPDISYGVKNDKYSVMIASMYDIYRSFVGKVDECLAMAESTMLHKGEANCESNIPMWLHFLNVLTVAKNFSTIFENGEAALHCVLLQRRGLLNLLLKFAKRDTKFYWFLKYKDVTNFEARRNLVRMLLPEGKEEDELHEMLIDRSQLLAESFEYIGQADAASLHGGLFMEFKNEEATGPGVLREWFCLLCKEIVNPQNVLFLPCPNDHRRFFPNPASVVDPLHLKYHRFTGRVIGLALMHKVQVGIVFDRMFFLQLAGQPVTLEDVRDADPVFYRSCKQILEMDAALLDSDALGLTFAKEIEILGSKKTIELCPGGKDISVNSKNRADYVALLIHNSFVTPISEQVSQFALGFGDILSKSKYKQIFFQSLDLEDFDRLIGGSNGILCAKEWKAHTEYNGYKVKDRQIGWFWKILESMSDEQRRSLLFFWTSVKYLPIDGFAGLSSRLYIYRSSDSQECLPTSHTCFYRLCLPAYKTKSVMQERLHLITQESFSCTFGTW